MLFKFGLGLVFACHPIRSIQSPAERVFVSGNDLDERRSIYFPVIRVFFGFGSTREVCSPGAGEAIVELLAALLDTLQSESYLLRHLQEPGQNGSLWPESGTLGLENQRILTESTQ